jgi:hypothetical protein
MCFSRLRRHSRLARPRKDTDHCDNDFVGSSPAKKTIESDPVLDREKLIYLCSIRCNANSRQPVLLSLASL